MAKPRRRCKPSEPVLSMEDKAPTAGRPISQPFDYKYGPDLVTMFLQEPDEVFPLLSDLRNALAHAATTVKEGGNELASLKNSLICMHDVLKAYEEHGFEVPKRLTAIHERLEQRRAELDPKGPHL